MNSVQLEQLISGYLDNELSPKRKLEVETLLQSDATAKKLYDEFVNIRNEIRQARRYNLPHDFQQNLFERIDAEIISISGKRVEQTTSVDFTIPMPQTRKQSDWQIDRETNRKSASRRRNEFRVQFLRRLKNPRILVFPAVALLIGGLFFFADMAKNREVAFVVPIEPPVIIEPVDTPPERIIPPSPKAAGGSSSGTNVNQTLAIKDGKPIVEVSCELSPLARDSQYIPTLLVDSGYDYTIRENGNKAVTVYEFEMPTKQLLPFILSLENASREKITAYEYPVGILSLMNRSPAIGDAQVIDAVIMRLNVSKND